MSNTVNEAKALQWLLQRGWTLQVAMHYIKSNPDFVKALLDSQEADEHD